MQAPGRNLSSSGFVPPDLHSQVLPPSDVIRVIVAFRRSVESPNELNFAINVMLPGGLLSGADPVLVRTKYFDYQSEWPWQAVREYTTV